MEAITDNEERALARLPEDSRNEVEEALVRWWAIRMQELDAVAAQLFGERNIETAVGVQLDGLGAIVGEARGGREDDPYRIRIRARILLNLSSGRADEILRILRMVTPLVLGLREEFPGAITITVTGGTATLPEDLFAVALEAKAAGVRLFLRHQLGADADRFTFKGGVGLGFPTLVKDALGPVSALDEGMEAPAPLVFTPDPGNPGVKFSSDYQITIFVSDSYFIDPPENTYWIVEFWATVIEGAPLVGPYYYGQDVTYDPSYFPVGLLLPDTLSFSGVALTFDANYAEVVQGGLDTWGCVGTMEHSEAGGKLVNVMAG